jgi:isochorismatase family protein
VRGLFSFRTPSHPFRKEHPVASAETSYSGLGALLTAEESVLLLVDHQGFQFANTHSHEPQLIVNNVVALAKTAKVFGVPTILTTVLEERGGYIIKGIQDVFPHQKPINRTLINAWQDQRFVDAVKNTGRKKLVIAALWTEVCLAISACDERFSHRLSRSSSRMTLTFCFSAPTCTIPQGYSGPSTKLGSRRKSSVAR